MGRGSEGVWAGRLGEKLIDWKKELREKEKKREAVMLIIRRQ
jgi:hypothetical protein